MDLVAVLIPVGMVAALFFWLWGERSNSESLSFLNRMLSPIERLVLKINSTYKGLRELSENPHAPVLQRFLCKIAASVAWYIWVVFLIVLGALVLYRRAIRSLFRLI